MEGYGRSGGLSSPVPALQATSTPTSTFITVFIVKIKNSQRRELGNNALIRQIRLPTDAAFEGTASEKIFRIGTIGRHWRYGEKEDDGQDRIRGPWLRGTMSPTTTPHIAISCSLQLLPVLRTFLGRFEYQLPK